jgi:phytoene synthase
MPQPSLDSADLAACRDLLRQGSRSFFAASLLLPRRVHRPALALYAFCRVADDLIDADGDGPGPTAALVGLRARLDAIYAGRPQPFAADRALAAVVLRHAIPQTLLDALLEGFEWDAAGRRYDSLAELEAYAARVAGTVGAMMATLMGERSAEGVARACDLGVAMQLSNIVRDVGEDARAGRLYLPQEWLRAAGIDPDAWLAHPSFDPALAGVVQRLLHRADQLYRRADSGITALPRGCRPGIGVARHLYAEIGQQVVRQGYNSVGRRAVVPPVRKLRLLARSLSMAARGAKPVDLIPMLEAARFLVQAVVAAPPPPRPAVRPPLWQAFDERVAWLCALFDQLDQRQMSRERS